MQVSWKIILDTLLIFCCNCVWALKDVMIQIDPPVVRRGDSAVLRCSYDLEGDLLWVVKWYRGQREFYRYTPNEVPVTKVFPFTGLEVNLQLSDEHEVTLQNVDFSLSGNFTCEVSTDAPYFFTASATEYMIVVVLPKNPPTLTTERSEYGIGDTVRANCTSEPSRPSANLVFSLNNMVVPTKQEYHNLATRNLVITHATTEFQLFPSHFREGPVELRCLAQVTNLYQRDTVLRLDNVKDPVPERVTSQNQASFHKLSTILLDLLILRMFN